MTNYFLRPCNQIIHLTQNVFKTTFSKYIPDTKSIFQLQLFNPRLFNQSIPCFTSLRFFIIKVNKVRLFERIKYCSCDFGWISVGRVTWHIHNISKNLIIQISFDLPQHFGQNSNFRFCIWIKIEQTRSHHLQSLVGNHKKLNEKKKKAP